MNPKVMSQLQQWTDGPKWIIDCHCAYYLDPNHSVAGVLAATEDVAEISSWLRVDYFKHSTFFVIASDAFVEALKSENPSKDIRKLHLK